MRIAILGLHHDSNMGDPLICQTGAFAVKIKYSQAGIIAGGGIIHYKVHD